MKTLIFVINIILLSGSQTLAQKADYLIAENPADLVIYNKYQQRLSGQVLDQFSAYTPFRIVEQDELLSDQISRASRVEYNNRILFILKDDENHYLQKNETGYIKIFNNCKMINDTIKITADHRINLFSRPEFQYRKSEQQPLEKDQLCIRIFQHKQLYFIKVSGKNPVFGWTQLAGRPGWDVVKTDEIRLTSIPDKLIFRLRIKIESVNREYQNFFSYFNRKYNQNKIIPKWELEISDHEISGKLNDPKIAGQLQNSSRYLMQDIDNIFLGSELSVAYSDSAFTIRLENKRQ
jgi:hypothetical protein